MASASGLLSAILFGFGSILIGISSGIGLVAAFESNVWGVYAGLAVFLLGYKMAQAGAREPHPGTLSFATIHRWATETRSTDALSILGGGGFMGVGFLLVSRSITSQDPLIGISAAIILGAGYILAHWGINNTLV